MSRTRRVRQRRVRERRARQRRVGQRSVRQRATLAVLVAGTAACQAPMSIFGAAGDGGRRVSGLAWFMIITAAVVYLVTMALLLVGMSRNRGRYPDAVDMSEPGTGFIVWGGGVMPVVVLTAVFVVGLAAMGRFPAEASERSPHFTITGH